jgi:phosphoglycolate phosphatase-like HAD superfamily hydrolase
LFQHIFGQRNDSIIRQFMGKDISPQIIEEVSQDKENIFRAEIVKELQPFPGVVELLKVLKDNNICSAIASSAPLKNIQVIVQGLRIQDYFQAVVYGQEVREGKPSRKFFSWRPEIRGGNPQCLSSRMLSQVCSCL